MAAIIAFGISITALALFAAFKFYESTHEVLWYDDLRKKGDAVIVTWVGKMREAIAYFEHYLSLKNIFHFSVHTSASAVAKTARKIEGQAHKVTRAMTHSARRPAAETKSSFLQEVSTHKKSLDTERIKRETSLTSETEVTPE